MKQQQQHAQGDGVRVNRLPVFAQRTDFATYRSMRRLTRTVLRPLDFGGLVVALVYFWLSLTPSLLPRAWLYQGLVSGLSAAAGYAIGCTISALLRPLRPAAPPAHYQRSAWILLKVAAVLGTLAMLWQAYRWQNELRALVDLHDASEFSALGVLLATALTAALLLLVARLVRALTRWLIHQVNRVAPRPVSVAVGVLLAAVLVVGAVQDVVWREAVAALNQAASIANETTRAGTTAPSSPTRSGSLASLVPFASLGRQGREFVARGPTLPDLQAFHGPACCRAPIRVYVGLDSAPSTAQRAALAVRELERTGAFERRVLAIFTTTGTGWVNPRVAAALEYLYRGDTAEVALQYSFLPSAMSFLVDQSTAASAGQELIGAVLHRLAQRPPGQRPQVLLYGESLGTYGTEQAFADLKALRAQVDGALLVGPTFANPIWQQLVAQRAPWSPPWRPVLGRGTGAYFARTAEDLAGVAEGGAAPRVVYLQNASDPVTWWSWELAYRKPAWAAAKGAPDRAGAFRWYPIVTFWQVGLDLVDSLGVPAGHGHAYGATVVDGWVAVAKPAGWRAEQTQRLRALIASLDE